ncbi:MAG: exo-rhamnogalacturonan lyase family protein [Armatimonadota bacterium]|jgi:hypothetical protein
MEALTVNVTSLTALTGPRPVSGGVPLPEGMASEAPFALLDRSGRPVPVQTQTLARWPDGSIRWLLLDFTAAPPPHGTACFRLVCDTPGRVPLPERPVEVLRLSPPCVRSGGICIQADTSGLLVNGARISLTARSENGQRFTAAGDSAALETCGPLRTTLLLRGSLRSASGDRLFGFQMRASLFADFDGVLLEPLIVVDSENGALTLLREMRLTIQTPSPVTRMSAGGDEGATHSFEPPVRLFQHGDSTYRIEPAGLHGRRAPGWATAATADGAVTVALRDFWQQWPKSLEANSSSLSVGLFPAFQEGTFDRLEPWYKHDYLFHQNCYRLRCGQARRWQIWLSPGTDGPSLAAHACAPLFPALDPTQSLATGVWGDVAPEGSPGMESYDRLARRMLEGFQAAIDTCGDYGAMNWGDWFGERGCNWGNNEYDTSRQLLLQFARTGDPRFLLVGQTAARHTAEVDVIHHVNDDLRRYFLEEVCASYTNRSIIENYPIRPGMMHAHCVGHVGGFHTVERVREAFQVFTPDATGKPYLCLDPYNVGHMFAQGMAWCYFLTGDPWVRETLERIGENLARLVEDRKLCFTGRPCAGRELGWTMLALAAIYELELDGRYLNAMRILAEDALEEQDPHCGGWLQELFGGHCDCRRRHHVGEAGFITSIRLNALMRYHQLSEDERIPPAVRRGIDHMNEDLWREEKHGWRYTSCPASPHMGQPGVTMMAIAGAVALFGKKEHLRILRRAWAGFESAWEKLPAPSPGVGKTYSSSLYGSAEAATQIAKNSQEI